MLTLIAVCVGKAEVVFGVVGLNGSLTEAAQELMLFGKIEAMREHVKFGKRRSIGDFLPIPLHFCNEIRELRDLRVIPLVFVKKEVIERVHPTRENNDRKGRRRMSGSLSLIVDAHAHVLFEPEGELWPIQVMHSGSPS